MPIINSFSGQRLIGFVNQKPLIAKFKINIDNFEFGFNQHILSKEYSGEFHPDLLGKSFEIVQKNYSAPIGKVLSSKGSKGTHTTINTLPWIASLFDVAESEMLKEKQQVSKEMFENIAQVIFPTNAFHKPKRDTGLITYLDISKQFNLQPSDQYTNIEKSINRLFTQYSNNMSVFLQVSKLPHSYRLVDQKLQVA